MASETLVSFATATDAVAIVKIYRHQEEPWLRRYLDGPEQSQS